MSLFVFHAAHNLLSLYEEIQHIATKCQQLDEVATHFKSRMKHIRVANVGACCDVAYLHRSMEVNSLAYERMLVRAHTVCYRNAESQSPY